MKKINFFAGVLLCGCLAAGCASESVYVDARDTTTAVLNTNSMSSADWVIITQEAGNAMLSSPLFAQFLEDYAMDAMDNAPADLSARERRTLTKPLLVLYNIQNNTGEHIDTRLLTNRLREVLFNSGKVRFTTYAAGAGQDIDQATADARDMYYDPNVKQETVMPQNAVNAYDLSLAGSIIKQKASSGRSHELSYFFSLTLTDNLTGEGVWTYTKEIKRQHKDGVFGM